MSATPQSYANHAHQPRLWGVGVLGWVVAVVAYGGTWFFGRVYVTALQDRIIRAEMRARCAALLSPDRMALFGDLTMKQIVALRFASDGELPALLERAVREGLPPDAIKRAVQQWVPDHDRT